MAIKPDSVAPTSKPQIMEQSEDSTTQRTPLNVVFSILIVGAALVLGACLAHSALYGDDGSRFAPGTFFIPTPLLASALVMVAASGGYLATHKKEVDSFGLLLATSAALFFGMFGNALSLIFIYGLGRN